MTAAGFARAGIRQDEPQIDPESAKVIEAWNLMGGAIEWQALDLIAELVGADDIERLGRGLAQLRDHLRDEAAGNG